MSTTSPTDAPVAELLGPSGHRVKLLTDKGGGYPCALCPKPCEDERIRWNPYETICLSCAQIVVAAMRAAGKV